MAQESYMILLVLLLARVSSVIRSKELYWKPERSDNSVLIQSNLNLISIGDLDQAVWIPSKSGHYTSAETRENIRAKLPVVKRWELIWFPQAIPRQSFHRWLAMETDLVLEKECFSGAIRVIRIVFFVEIMLKVEITFF